MEEYWNTDSFGFENYHITQGKEIPEKCKAIVSFVNDEERAMGLFQLPTEELKSIKQVHLLILNRELDNYQNEDLDALIEKAKVALEGKGMEFYIHFLNFYSDEFSKQLYSAFAKHNLFEIPILLDITNCPQAVMVPMAEVLIGHLKRSLTISYMLPDNYDTKLINEIDQFEADNSEIKMYGEGNVDNAVLIIFAGYEDKKAHKIAEYVNPNSGYLMNNIFAKDVHEMGRAMETMERHRDLISLDKYKQFNLSRYDVNRVLNSLQIIQQNHGDQTILIAPFSSKIQRLASLLFVSVAPNRAIIDTIPKDLSFRKISSGLRERLFYTIRRTDIVFSD